MCRGRNEKREGNNLSGLVSCIDDHGLTLTDKKYFTRVSSGRGGKQEEWGEDKFKTYNREMGLGLD